MHSFTGVDPVRNLAKSAGMSDNGYDTMSDVLYWGCVAGNTYAGYRMLMPKGKDIIRASNTASRTAAGAARAAKNASGKGKTSTSNPQTKQPIVREAACFVAGTLIVTESGDKPIEEIKIGDRVYSENVETGEKGFKKVKNLFVKKVYTLVHLIIDGIKIDTTENHPFWVIGKGWTLAAELETEDKVKLKTGDTGTVQSVVIEELDEAVTVYNFEVEDWHTYFVSDIGVLVHNRCDGSIFSERALEHIFHGNIKRNGTPSGYHHENIMSKLNISDYVAEDSFKVYKSTVEINGNTKMSSFFPKEWNRVDVLNYIKEARSGIQFTPGSSRAGWYSNNDSSGMPIRMWIKENGLIDTAFPVHQSDIRR